MRERLKVASRWMETSVEVWDSRENTWKQGSPLPYSVARGCAVTVDDAIILTGGHDNSSSTSMSSVLTLSAETGSWEPMAAMLEPRRDHACLFIELERSRGVLVTGGLGTNDDVLDSAEYLDLGTKEWTRVSALKIGRTEHTMSLIYGIPTVIGEIFYNALKKTFKSANFKT